MQEPGALLDLRGATQLAFATPVVGYRWPDVDTLNRDLRAAILQRAEHVPGMGQRSNVGGWHSGLDFLESADPAVVELKGMAARMARALLEGSSTAPEKRSFRIDGWANVLRPGDYHAPHNHPNAVWSGVYYVDAGDPGDGAPATQRPFAGELELLDPRVGPNMAPFAGEAFERRVRVKPEAGLMVCFPAWLRHFTHPHPGPGARISVAFNIQWGAKKAER